MSDIIKLLGSRIRELRRKAKLTISQLAEACQLSDNFIGCIERGERSPTIKTLERIASALNVKVADLFYFPPKRKVTDVASIRMQITKLVKKRDARTLELISRIIKNIADWTEEK